MPKNLRFKLALYVGPEDQNPIFLSHAWDTSPENLSQVAEEIKAQMQGEIEDWAYMDEHGKANPEPKAQSHPKEDSIFRSLYDKL